VSIQINLNPYLISVLFGQIVLNLFIIRLWKCDHLKKYYLIYKAEQKIHEGSIPRFGGLVMILSLFFIIYFDLFSSSLTSSLMILLLCLCPLILVTFLEDLKNNISPLIRLFFIFLSSFSALTFGNFKFPIVELPIIANVIIDYPWIFLLFLVLSVTSIVNAFNLIDGMNGLLLFTFTIVFLCLRSMAVIVEDNEWIYLLNILIIISVIQIFFNFPKAWVFSGDLGAYAYGFVIANMVIIFFGQHPEFLTWQAILILFYPALELIFTILRRLSSNKSLFDADTEHLHHQIFHFLKKRLTSKFWSNVLTTLILIPIWSFPLIWLIFLNNRIMFLNEILFGMLFHTMIYISFYFFFKFYNKLDQ